MSRGMISTLGSLLAELSRHDAYARILVGPLGSITDLNEHAEALFGYPREELLDRPIGILLPERFRTGHDALRNAYEADPIARPMGSERYLHGLRKDGGEIRIEIALMPAATELGGLLLT